MDNAPDSPYAQLTDKLKAANNILVTVSRNPSVDQLAALIGLTVTLNKLGKHAAAVFSGEVPSTIEFLQPEDTIEKNTDSLRDFIIALDKSKADKLRYKVEDQVVRIFITPYKTSITQDDLDFSQGDFNVDVVVAIGVRQQEELDEAITAHGRILHDATVTTINTSSDAGLGSINWSSAAASSLSELVATLVQSLGKDLLDSQIATALLTGIVSETDRFSNDKTSPQTMSISAVLMAAGANQQLVATKLDEPVSEPKEVPKAVEEENSEPAASVEPKTDDGALEIVHEGHEAEDSEPTPDSEQPVDQEPSTEAAPDFSEPEQAEAELPLDTAMPESSDGTVGLHMTGGSKPIFEPPSLGGTLTANSAPEGLDPTTDPLSQAPDTSEQLLNHTAPMATTPLELTDDQTPPVEEVLAPAQDPIVAPAVFTPPPLTPLEPVPAYVPEPLITGMTPPPPAWVPPSPDPLNLNALADSVTAEATDKTLADLEASVANPHQDGEDLSAARDEVSRALTTSPAAPGPIEALNAQPLGDALHPDNQATVLAPPADLSYDPTKFGISSDPTVLPVATDPQPTSNTTSPVVIDPTAPPPVPPPLPPQFLSKPSDATS